MKADRGSYSEEFKREAVRLMETGGKPVAQIARDLGVSLVDRQAEIVKDYHEVMRQLYELGWDDILEYDAKLPDHLMPEEYRKDILRYKC